MAVIHELDKVSELPSIPQLPPIDGWKQVPFAETHQTSEPLVPVGIFSDYRNIFSSSVYADEHHNSPYQGGLDGSSIAQFVRAGVAQKLEAAVSQLPYGHHLMVMDAYRTLEVQGALYRQYEGALRDRHPTWSDEAISIETQKYVSVPSTEPTRPSPHNTGGTVDLVIVKVNSDTQAEIDAIDAEFTAGSKPDWQREYLLEMRRSELIRRNATMLNFGTRFDYGGPEAGLRYYEEKLEQGTALTTEEEEALRNRRLLYQVMTAADFAPYAEEWWHWNDPDTQMGAKIAGRSVAQYGAVELSAKNLAFAKMRQLHHLNSVKLAQGETWTPPKGLEVHYKLARMAIRANNPSNIWNMTLTVDKIEPPEETAA